MVTHLPYRNWCSHCVGSSAQSDHHREQLKEYEEEVPTISIDYAFFGDRKDDGELQPIIVTKDRRHGTIRPHVVEAKGVNTFAVKKN